MIRHTLPATIAIGALAGALGGLMGVGGGILLVPLLVHLLREPQHEAQGVSLAFVIAIAAVAVLPYLGSERLDLGLAALLAVGALPGVLAGARVARRMSAQWLRRAFGIALLATGVRLLASPPAWTPESVAALWAWPWNVALGLAVGFLAGLLGLGGGTILVPVLVLGERIPQHVAQGISLLLIIPVGIVGVMTYARSGILPVRHLPGLVVGGAAGALTGALLAQRLAGSTLSRAFALFLIAVSAQMIFGRARVRAPAATPLPGGSV
jgi:uncharacterized membrane protein YfcA